MQEFLDEHGGRCVSCGFLAKAATGSDVPTSGVYEIDLTARRLGIDIFQHVPDTFYDPIKTTPKCFRYEIFLEAELMEALEGDKDTDRDAAFSRAALKVFHEDRNCPKWYPFTPGLSPKEHLDEVNALGLEQRRENFEQDMEVGRRNFEVAMADRLERSEGRRHSMMRWVAAVGVVLIAVEILAVVLGASPGSLLGDLLGR